MRLTERKLKRIIRQVMQESYPDGIDEKYAEECLQACLAYAKNGAFRRLAVEICKADPHGCGSLADLLNSLR